MVLTDRMLFLIWGTNARISKSSIEKKKFYLQFDVKNKCLNIKSNALVLTEIIIILKTRQQGPYLILTYKELQRFFICSWLSQTSKKNKHIFPTYQDDFE